MSKLAKGSTFSKLIIGLSNTPNNFKVRVGLKIAFTIILVLITTNIVLADGDPIVPTDTGVQDTATNIFGVLYLNWRLPFTAIGLLYAGFVAYTDEQNGISRCIKYVFITILIALVPSIIKLIGTVTKTPTS